MASETDTRQTVGDDDIQVYEEEGRKLAAVLLAGYEPWEARMMCRAVYKRNGSSSDQCRQCSRHVFPSGDVCFDSSWVCLAGALEAIEKYEAEQGK